MKKLLIGTVLLSVGLTMGACEKDNKDDDSLNRHSKTEVSEKKSEDKELDKKSEAQQTQKEQKELRAHAEKVAAEQKAKELAEQKAKEEAEAKRQAELAEQQRQQKIAEQQRVAAQQEKENNDEELSHADKNDDGKPVSQETIDNYEANQAETWAEEAEIEERLNKEEEERLAKEQAEQEAYEAQIIAEQDAKFSDEAKVQVQKEIDEEGYSRTSRYCDQVMRAVEEGTLSPEMDGGCLKQ
ncbi:hypothetical protein [Priestia megaterium]|uniref:hypothetical protein n=1 Tax=Priestia megaterium TaxID=1404 RepID=UPI002877C907|nr:hypothetical protein [Priestia megaterium]